MELANDQDIILPELIIAANVIALTALASIVWSAVLTTVSLSMSDCEVDLTAALAVPTNRVVGPILTSPCRKSFQEKRKNFTGCYFSAWRGARPSLKVTPGWAGTDLLNRMLLRGRQLVLP